MFSWEINKIIENCNYKIDSKTYLHIINTSPQIRRVVYKPFDDYFEIMDDQNNHWKFTVQKIEEK